MAKSDKTTDAVLSELKSEFSPAAIEPTSETKAIVDGFFVCRSEYGSRVIVQATDEPAAASVYEQYRSKQPFLIEPLTVRPYGHDVVSVVDNIPVRKLWTER